MGSPDTPIRPISIAIAAEATFAARAIDIDVKHLEYVLERAAKHVGTAFVEIYQNCNIFNDGAFDYATDKATKSDTTLYLEHGKPLIFGKDNAQRHPPARHGPGDRQHQRTVQPDDLLIHDEKAPSRAWRFLLSRMRSDPPVSPIEQRALRRSVRDQIDQAVQKQGDGDLQDLDRRPGHRGR